MRPSTPLTISRSGHTISRSRISPNALKVLYRLRDNGYKAFLVGGSVRDLLLERTPKDFDLATDATPTEIKKLFRNCRLVGRRFRLAHLHFKDEIIEVATFRKGGDPAELDESDTVADDGSAEQPEMQRHTLGHLHKSDQGVLLRDNLFGTPEEDAWRRDFTVNALAYNIADFAIIDYVGGVEDLEKRLIRTIGDPAGRFAEDPVRMLRAIRFAAQLDFQIEHHCWGAMVENSRRITLASPVRLFDEVCKLFLSGAAEKCWQLLWQSGLSAAIFPDFSQWLLEMGGSASLTSLQWLDTTVKNRKPASTPLLLATVFTEYLTAKGEKLLCRDPSFQARLDGALALFMTEIAGRLVIHQRTVMRLREILLLQQRLVKTPGRKPENVISRPAFSEALDYLRCCAITDPHRAKTVHWWERFHADGKPVTGNGSELTLDEPKRRTRKRRKRRQPPPTGEQ
jgi:poly(A) polymerase